MKLKNNDFKQVFDEMYAKEDPWYTKRGIHEQYRLFRSFNEIKNLGIHFIR